MSRPCAWILLATAWLLVPARLTSAGGLQRSTTADRRASPEGLRLIDAVKRQDLATVRALLAQRVDVNAAEPDGSTALHWAAQRNNAALVDLLERLPS